MIRKEGVEDQDLDRILTSAERLGIELNEEDAQAWLKSVTTVNQEEIVVDEKSGIFGHRLSMLDFSDDDLAHFRKIGRLVEFEDIPDQVETALALSGSAAQSKIQTYPGDADYFERVNIMAETREEACLILARLMRQKALDTLCGTDYRLIEVKFGNYPQDMIRNGKLAPAGSPIAWMPHEIENGRLQGETPLGKEVEVSWQEVAHDPGWCKLDWVVADTVRKELVNASNMLDVTWEAPDGKIVPMDGYLDSFFQEVYLDAESIPIFSKLVKHVSGNALDDYVEQLEHEVKKYVTKNPNYGKVAKRLYNIFRLTGRYPEAVYLRELFDEPTTMLYQIGALIRTVEECCLPGSEIDIHTIIEQTDKLILGVIETLEGAKEGEIVRHLLQLRDCLSEDAKHGKISAQANAAQAEVVNIVNNFFYEKLTGMPSIQAYIDSL